MFIVKLDGLQPVENPSGTVAAVPDFCVSTLIVS
jgi:hypothetical protein